MTKQNIADKLNSPKQPHYNHYNEIRDRKLQKIGYEYAINGHGICIYQKTIAWIYGPSDYQVASQSYAHYWLLAR